MKINAYAALASGKPLVPYVYEKDASDTDVIIDVVYRTLSSSDVMFIDNAWGDSKYPLVPSENIIGKVIGKGKAVHTLAVGDYVGVGYQVWSCGTCEYCRQGLEQCCPSQKVSCVDENGGFSDKRIVDARFAFKLPKNLQNPGAAPLFSAGVTVFSGITNYGISKGMNAGVIGIGRLGNLAVKFLSALECNTVAFTDHPDKIRDLESNGISVIHPKNIQSAQQSFDFILYTGTHSVPWDTYLKILKPTGTLCIVGLPNEPVSFDAVSLSDHAKRKIVGNYIGSRQDMKRMIAFASENNIAADVDIYPLKEVNEVVNLIRQKKIKYSAVISG
jgi:D-arabinose 1-dehydrogenase-like Zn-dependent alcohol dehydrogenase